MTYQDLQREQDRRREQRQQSGERFVTFLDAFICAEHEKTGLSRDDLVNMMTWILISNLNKWRANELERSYRTIYGGNPPALIEHHCLCHQPRDNR